MYFLDFDRTIFDKDAHTAYLATLPLWERMAGTEKAHETSLLNDLAAEGAISYEAGELSRFLYPDAASFLREKGNEVMIITYGYLAHQKLKVKSALEGIPRIAVIYTGDVRKGDYLAPNIGMYGRAPVLVDDTPLELEIVERQCPNVRLFQMCRNDRVGDGRWPIIRSLLELP